MECRERTRRYRTMKPLIATTRRQDSLTLADPSAQACETAQDVLLRDPMSLGPQLRPFFGYYGGKWRDALKNYPPPKYDTIVEPFAGSAGYALRYADRQIILCEADPIVAAVWDYLIRVEPEEILAIPDVEPHQSVDDLAISQEARWLVGFWLNRGAASPRKSPSRWMRDRIRPGSFWGERVRQTIASQVHAIRHWKVVNAGYSECGFAGPATWFVDPPYQLAGKHYRYGSNGIDYGDLAVWCTTRHGQVIVCENLGASWLPFREVAQVKTTRGHRRSLEVVWTVENDVGADPAS